jgi:hypothetical protein
MSMTLDTPQDSQALAVGFEAVRTSTLFGRDLATVWVAAAQQIVLLSVETNEAAIEVFRTRFGPSAIPTAADVWNWWAGVAAGLIGAYHETLKIPLAPPVPTAVYGNGETAIEVNLTEPATVAVTVGS